MMKMLECCGNCKWIEAHPQKPKTGYCFLNPPVVSFVPITIPIADRQGKLLGEKMEMHPATARPMVEFQHRCQHFSPQIAH